MKHLSTIVLFLACAMCIAGCGKKYPKDFPKVYPITVTVTDGATPLSDVVVTFLSVGTGPSYAVSGITDASGNAKIITAQGAYVADGLPPGDYVITLVDDIKTDMGIPPEQIAAMSRAEQGELEKKRQEMIKAYKRKVTDKFNKSGGKTENRSPVRFTAKEEKNELKIDISEYK